MKSPPTPHAPNLSLEPEKSASDPSPSPNVSMPYPPDFDTFVASLSERFPLQDPNLLDVFKAGVRAGAELATAHVSGDSGGTKCNIDGFLDEYEGGIRDEAYGKGVADKRARSEGDGSQKRLGEASFVASHSVRERKESEGLKEEGTSTLSHPRIKVEENSETILLPSLSSSQASSDVLAASQVKSEDEGLSSPTTPSAPLSELQQDIEAMAHTLALLDLTRYRLGHHVVEALAMVRTIVILESQMRRIASRQAESGHHESVQCFVEQQRAIRQERLRIGVPILEPGGEVSSQDVILVGQRFAEEPGYLDPLVRDLWSAVGLASPAGI